MLYWAGIFALGFVLGTIRTVWLSQLIGEVGAVACELPVMLLASWFWARYLVARYRVQPGLPAFRMGLVAFTLLMLGEFALGVFAFGLQPQDWLAGLFRTPGALGLAGQVIFAGLPMLATRRTA